MHMFPRFDNFNNHDLCRMPPSRGMALFEPQPGPRFKSDVFVGVRATDDLEFLKDWRVKAKQALEENNKEKYLIVAFEVVDELRKLPKTNVFYLDPDAYVGPDSHLHNELSAILALTFRKAHHAKYGSQGSNHSGVYLIGPKGVGKSSIMKIACLVSGILLDNTASAYADHVLLNNNHTICDVIASAMKERGANIANYDRSSLPCEVLKASAAVKGLSIALFLDEAHVAYTPKEWQTLHSLTTSCGASVILSGCEYRLPLFVKGDQRCASTIRRLTMRRDDQPPLESLNDTKITPLFVTGLTTPGHYCSFLNQRPDIRLALFPKQDPKAKTADIPGWEDVIRSVHTVFGGRLRGLDEFVQRSESVLDFTGSIPGSTIPANAVQRKILELISKQTSGRGFDPFDVVEIPVKKMEQELPYGAEVIENALSCLQEDKLILYGRNGYRYYSPIVHRIMSSHTTAFISHATDDFKPTLPDIVTLLKDLRVICEDQIEHMGKSSLTKWMLGQIDRIRYFPYNRILIVLSALYCRKIKLKDGNGCSVEFEEIIRQAKESVDVRNKLLWCYNGTFEELDEDVLFTIAKLYNPECPQSNAKGHLPFLFHLTRDRAALLGALQLGNLDWRNRIPLARIESHRGIPF